MVRYNTYLLLLALLVSTGCQSPKSKERRQIATLRVHVEVFADSTGANEPVSIGRSSPIMVTIDKQTILTEADVSRAQVVEDAGGFTLQIRFDRLGTQILENHTASRPGSRLAIFSEFGERLEKARWLAAPVIRHRISDGLLVFTPDADREEAGQIALGLNNLVRRSQPLFIKEPE